MVHDYAVVYGKFSEGFKVAAPFESEKEASDWAFKHFPFTEWWVVPVVEPGEPNIKHYDDRMQQQ